MLKAIMRKLGWLLLILILLCELVTLSLRWIDPPMWSWRMYRAYSPPENYPEQVKHQWRALSKISAAMPLAVVASEDQRFPVHWGLDFEALVQAIKDNQEGGRLRGGSTITQQTAKNLWLYPSQSYLRKGVEAVMSLLLELNLSKTRILEIYLNIVEFGPGIYGVEAASQFYFNRPANRLTIDQAASLAAMLPSPYRYSLQPKSAFMYQRTAWIKQQMRQLGNNYLDDL